MVSKLFPHHLNSFDNVPANYNNGALTNITTPNPTGSKTYTNIINYTTQATASGFTYRNFSSPLTNCKVVLFLTTLFSNGALSTTANIPLDLRISTTILSTSTYRLSVTYGTDSYITKLRFSMIIFDQKDVESSYAYQLVYTRVDFPTAGGFVDLPTQFTSNSIIGILEYSTTNTRNCTMNWNMVYQASPQGITMTPSAPRNGRIPASRFGFSLFYLKTWACPNSTYYNISSGMCESCSIPYCTTCLNIDVCQVCDTASGYFLNPNSTNRNLQCSICTDPNCLICPNTSICTTCDSSLNYFAQSGSCVLCNISNCQLCENLTFCLTCNGPNGYVLNPATGQCVSCNIPNCLNCINSTFCGTCDEANGYFFNSTSQQCSLCGIPNCLQCSSLGQCSNCDQPNNYFLANTTNVSAQC